MYYSHTDWEFSPRTEIRQPTTTLTPAPEHPASSFGLIEYIQTHMWIHTHTHTCMYTYLYIHVCMYTYLHIKDQFLKLCLRFMIEV